MSVPEARLRVREAVALGLLHGPAELLPVSSSGHMTVVPWLLGFEYSELDGELRKAFEVTLHAGTAAALVWVWRAEARSALSIGAGRLAGVLVAASVPAAACGLAFGDVVEERLSAPGSVAAGMLVGGTGLLLADLRPQARSVSGAGWRDGGWLGLAQACALVPGISRNGATLTAGRLLGFRRIDANRLSRWVAGPVILGATGLEGRKLWRRGVPAGTAAAFAAGLVASFASTVASEGIVGLVERDAPFAPLGLYRVGLGLTVLGRLRRRARARGSRGERSGTAGLGRAPSGLVRSGAVERMVS